MIHLGFRDPCCTVSVTHCCMKSFSFSSLNPCSHLYLNLSISIFSPHRKQSWVMANLQLVILKHFAKGRPVLVESFLIKELSLSTFMISYYNYYVYWYIKCLSTLTAHVCWLEGPKKGLQMRLKEARADAGSFNISTFLFKSWNMYYLSDK